MVICDITHCNMSLFPTFVKSNLSEPQLNHKAHRQRVNLSITTPAQYIFGVQQGQSLESLLGLLYSMKQEVVSLLPAQIKIQLSDFCNRGT